MHGLYDIVFHTVGSNLDRCVQDVSFTRNVTDTILDIMQPIHQDSWVLSELRPYFDSYLERVVDDGLDWERDDAVVLVNSLAKSMEIVNSHWTLKLGVVCHWHYAEAA